VSGQLGAQQRSVVIAVPVIDHPERLDSFHITAPR
jgi:hypothetical protein